MGIGNLGFSEMLVIAVLVLVFFGPRRMPEIGRTVGGALREFRRGLNEIQRELQEAERMASLDPDKPASQKTPDPPSPLAAVLGTASSAPEAASPTEVAAAPETVSTPESDPAAEGEDEPEAEDQADYRPPDSPA